MITRGHATLFPGVRAACASAQAMRRICEASPDRGRALSGRFLPAGRRRSKAMRAASAGWLSIRAGRDGGEAAAIAAAPSHLWKTRNFQGGVDPDRARAAWRRGHACPGTVALSTGIETGRLIAILNAPRALAPPGPGKTAEAGERRVISVGRAPRIQSS